DDVRPKSQACVDNGEAVSEILSYDTCDSAEILALTGRADAFSPDSALTAHALTGSDGNRELVGDMRDAALDVMTVNEHSDYGPAMAAALQHLIDTRDYARILAQWGIEDGLIDVAMINERPQF